MTTTEEARAKIEGVKVAQMIIEFQREFRHSYGPETHESSLCAVGPLQTMIGLAIKNGHLSLPTPPSSSTQGEKMAESEPWAGMEGEPFLHIYGQYQWHSPAMIRGTRAGLEALRLAIDAALAYSPAPANVIASDGEGYEVQVHLLNVVSLLGKPEYLMEAEYAASNQEYARAQRNNLFVLGYASPPVAEESK